jgi:hypothetical protein
MFYKTLMNTELILIDEDIYRFNKTQKKWTLIKEKKDSKHRTKIICDGKQFFYYRVKYWLANDEFDIFDTECQIDHINVDEKDNRLSNLRPCTNEQNSQNKKNMNGVPVRGWTYEPIRYKKKPYVAYVMLETGKRKTKHFHTETEAHNWYLENRPRF